MIDEQSLRRWLNGANEIFEALEWRENAYNLCRRWVKKWFTCRRFCITDKDRNFLEEFRLPIFDKKVKSRIKNSLIQLKDQLEKHTEEITFAFSLYLISWNIRRFEIYFEKNKNFSFEKFFISLNEVFNNPFLNNLEELRKLHLFKDKIEEKLIIDVYEKLHQKLKEIGIGTQNEAVSTIKIMHIISPFYIPLLDNPIAKALKRENVCEFFNYYRPSKNFWRDLNKLKSGGLKLSEIRRIVGKLYNELGNVQLNKEALLEYIKWLKGKFNRYQDIIFQMENERKKFFKTFRSSLLHKVFN